MISYTNRCSSEVAVRTLYFTQNIYTMYRLAHDGMCGCVYIYIHMFEIENMHVESCWYTSDVVGDTGVSTKPVYEDIMGGTCNSHTHTYTRNYIWYCCAAQQYHDYGCMCVWERKGHTSKIDQNSSCLWKHDEQPVDLGPHVPTSTYGWVRS